MSALISLVPLLVMPVVLGAGLLARSTRIGTCWWVGFTVSAAAVIAGHGIGLPQSVVLGVIAIATPVALVAMLRRRHAWRRPTSRDVLLVVLLGVFSAPLLVAILLRTLDYPALGADAIVIWYAKAKALYHWAPFSQRPFENYPELGPAAWMLVLKWLGAERENVARLIFVVPYAVWFLAVLELFKRPSPWVSAAILSGVATLFFDFDHFTRGDQDGLVMMTAGMAAIFMVKTVLRIGARDRASTDVLDALLGRPEGRQDTLLAVGFAGVLALIKQEGTVVGAILMATWLSVLLMHERRAVWPNVLRRLRPYLAIYAGLTVLWPALVLLHGIDVTKIQGEHFTVSSVVYAVTNVDRWPSISAYFLRHYRSEGLVVVACLVLSGAAAWVSVRVRPALGFLWTVYGFHALFVGFVFLATRQSVDSHLETAFSRLILQGRFALVLVLCLTGVLLGQELMRATAEDDGGPAALLTRRNET